MARPIPEAWKLSASVASSYLPELTSGSSSDDDGLCHDSA